MAFSYLNRKNYIKYKIISQLFLANKSILCKFSFFKREKAACSSRERIFTRVKTLFKTALCRLPTHFLPAQYVYVQVRNALPRVVALIYNQTIPVFEFEFAF